MKVGSELNNIIVAAIFTVLGILLPVLFHLVGLGSAFLPMYLPLAVGAFLLTGPNALIMGVCTPLLSSFITGMPPLYPPIAFMMAVQLGFFCLVIAALRHRTKLPVAVILLIGIVLERMVLVAGYYLVAPLFSISIGIASLYDILKSVPGIILLALAVPVTVPRCIQIMNRKGLHLYENKQEREP